MPKMALTPDLAWAAATDAGNRAMRKRGADRWNVDDYNAAAREYERVYAHIEWPQRRTHKMEKTEWLPFETAPKDGTFLVWLERPHVAMDTHVGLMRNHPNVAFINGLLACDLSKPLYWMPLPAAPEPRSTRGFQE